MMAMTVCWLWSPKDEVVAMVMAVVCYGHM